MVAIRSIGADGVTPPVHLPPTPDFNTAKLTPPVQQPAISGFADVGKLPSGGVPSSTHLSSGNQETGLLLSHGNSSLREVDADGQRFFSDEETGTLVNAIETDPILSRPLLRDAKSSDDPVERNLGDGRRNAAAPLARYLEVDQDGLPVHVQDSPNNVPVNQDGDVITKAVHSGGGALRREAHEEQVARVKDITGGKPFKLAYNIANIVRSVIGRLFSSYNPASVLNSNNAHIPRGKQLEEERIQQATIKHATDQRLHLSSTWRAF